MNILCPTEKDKLESYLDSVECLPPTPALMIRLIELFRQSDRDVDEIVGLMRQDLSVTAEVLRRCNSSFFGNEEPVMDVYEAVFRMGFYEVYRVTVALFGLQAMSMARVTKSIPAEALWRHSAITAIVSGALARELGESRGHCFYRGRAA
jgi:HD-like signal output (HDOD) protein